MIWIEAARPRTLVAAIAPVLVGTAASGRFIVWRFVAALAVALLIQVGVNFANDYYDAESGVDSPDRIGPRRLVASGEISRSQMRIAMAVAFAFAAIVGTLLAFSAGKELLVFGGAAILAALAYSGGPRPYSALGLGELFVFVFFGLVATGASAYVQTETVNSVALIAGASMGLLAAAILAVNNLRDIDTDADAGRRTLAVRFGPVGARELYRLLVIAAFAPVFVISIIKVEAWPMLALATAPLAISCLRSISRIKEGPELTAVLGQTARLELFFGVFLAAGLGLS